MSTAVSNWGGRPRWTTHDEIDFLTRIGTHSLNRSQDRIAALRQYRDTMHKRANWGDVDPAAAERFIEGELTNPA